MPPRLTHEQYLIKVNEKMGNEYVVLTEYTLSKNPVKVKHLKCGREYWIRADNLIQGVGCKACVNKNQTNSHMQYVQKVNKIHNGKIEVIGRYINQKTKILHKCANCEEEYYAFPNAILKNKTSMCKHCSSKLVGLKKVKSCEEYILDLKRIRGNEFSVSEKYNGVKSKILHTCNKCGSQFKASPTQMLHYYKMCDNCSDGSKGEMIIKSYLMRSGYVFMREYAFDDLKVKLPLKFDFAIFQNDISEKPKTVIEFDGRQHYEANINWGGVDAYYQRIYNDALKDGYCADNNIQLIRIKYDELNIIDSILDEWLNKEV